MFFLQNQNQIVLAKALGVHILANLAPNCSGVVFIFIYKITVFK